MDELYLEPEKGTSLNTFALEMAYISHRDRCIVRSVFNGVKLSCYPSQTADFVIGYYNGFMAGKINP
jgi:hypothetical protein